MLEPTSTIRFARRPVRGPFLVERWFGLTGAFAARLSNIGKFGSVSSCSPDTHAFLRRVIGIRPQYRLSNRLIDRPTRLNQPRTVVTRDANNVRATSLVAIGTRRFCGAVRGLQIMRHSGG
jgi:hypothetical protein